MPKRSNYFQQLIHFIEQHISGPETSITQSAMLTPLDGGNPREVDILVETTLNGHPLRFGLECRDHQRPQSVSWIEELDGKCRYLPIDFVVAVSNSGFTSTALARARQAKIRTLSMDEALDAKWIDDIARWVMALVEWNWRLVGAELACGDGYIWNSSGNELLNARIVRAGGQTSTFQQDVQMLHDGNSKEMVLESVSNDVNKYWEKGPGVEWDFRLLMNANGNSIIDMNGKSHPIESITLVVRGAFSLVPVEKRYYLYNTQKLARGEVIADDKAYKFAMLFNDKNEPNAVNVVIENKKK